MFLIIRGMVLIMMQRWVAVFLWAAVLTGSAPAEPECVSSGVGDHRIFLPLDIDLKCPSDSNGTLESTRVSCEPGVKRLYGKRVSFRNSLIATIWLGKSENGQPFERSQFIDLRTEKDQILLRMGKIIEEQADWYMREVCRGSAEKKARFFETLKENKAKFGSWIKTID